MARVTGVGGVFLKAADPKALAAWYAKHLGIKLSEYGGATFGRPFRRAARTLVRDRSEA